MSWTEDYLRLRFKARGRERPEVDCWGLYRLIVGERTGVWLNTFGEVGTPLGAARAMARESRGQGWEPVAPGHEQELDAVLMFSIAGEGRLALAAPQHIGCVVSPGTLIDIEDGKGVMVRSYRGHLANRVRGIYRPVGAA